MTNLNQERANETADKLTRQQIEILRHTEYGAAGGYYCGGGKDMDVLVALGLMQSAGRKSFAPDEYFSITSAGRAALKAWIKSQSANKSAATATLCN